MVPRVLVALLALLGVASLATAGSVIPSVASAPQTPSDAGPGETVTPDLREGQAGGGSDSGSGSGGEAADSPTRTSTPKTASDGLRLGRAIPMVVAGLLLGGMALLLGLRGGDEVSPPSTPADTDVASGDRPEPAPDDGVARAWYRMVARLDTTDRESRTPAELARRAIDEGLDPDAVRELTELFRAVRYGSARPTTDRERRAARALERLEDE
jgi:hypothetical protein